jgi:predicted short-subunit dehydrogenase-like oxidoreductase (DUF2520 family)
MMRTVIERLAAATPEETLSGPAARGDWETMRRHLGALTEHHPEAVALYRVLTEAAMRLTGQDSGPEFFQ